MVCYFLLVRHRKLVTGPDVSRGEQVTSHGDTVLERLKRSWNIHAGLKQETGDGDTISLGTRVYYALTSKWKLDRVDQRCRFFFHFGFERRNCCHYGRGLILTRAKVGKKRKFPSLRSRSALHAGRNLQSKAGKKSKWRKIATSKFLYLASRLRRVVCTLAFSELFFAPRL